MSQIKIALHNGTVVSVAFLILCFAFLNSRSVVAQSGNGRTPSPTPIRKKVSKTNQAALPKRVKTHSPNAVKAPTSKAVEPKKIVQRPRQVSLPLETKGKPIVEESVARESDEASTSLKLEESNNEMELTGSSMRNVVLERKREATGNTNFESAAPTAKIERIRIYQNIFQDGGKGVRVHIKFRISNLEQTEAKLSSYFYLVDPQSNPAGETANHPVKSDVPFVEENFVSSSNESIFSDYTLFMPYETLERAYGSYNNNNRFKVKMQVQINNLDNSLLAVSNYIYMTIE